MRHAGSRLSPRRHRTAALQDADATIGTPNALRREFPLSLLKRTLLAGRLFRGRTRRSEDRRDAYVTLRRRVFLRGQEVE